MGQLQDAFRDAAGEVANIKAQPSNRYWWLYGTIKAKNANGTLDVAIDGVTIQQVKATVSCMMANVDDRVIVLKAGPLMTCVDVIATSDRVGVPDATNTSKGIVQVGDGLSVADGIVSVDNWAYVKLLWSGKSQSAVTLSESCASFRAIVAAIGGYDEVVEASTLVWEPDGKTFDVASAFVVGTNDWRSLRMRLTASGKNLSVDYNLGQTSGGAVDNAYLLYVVGVV